MGGLSLTFRLNWYGHAGVAASATCAMVEVQLELDEAVLLPSRGASPHGGGKHLALAHLGERLRG